MIRDRRPLPDEERRASDGETVLGTVFARARAMLERRLASVDAVLGGQLLLVGTGITVAVAAPLLQPSARGWAAFGAVSAVMTGTLVVSAFLPWRRWSQLATLAFPLLVCAGLVTLAAVSPGLAAPLTGVLVLCAAFVGLAHGRGTIALELPASAATFVYVNDGWSRVTTVRLVIAAVIWTLLSELLAHLTQRQRDLSQALRVIAQTDVLTGVGNRREIDLRLAGSQRGDVVVICDLDHFKALNDSQGHLSGDRVLADFGALLHAELRSGDFAGRFGGEEFMLLLPDTATTTAAVLLNRLHRSWSLMHRGVTFSAGIAQCKTDRSVADTVKAADVALYRAKAEGRDCDRFEPDSDTAARDQRQDRHQQRTG
jgi:diguanylate cyclase (GGDEF)-like protein